MKVNWLHILFAFIAGYMVSGMMKPRSDKIVEGLGGCGSNKAGFKGVGPGAYKVFTDTCGDNRCLADSTCSFGSCEQTPDCSKNHASKVWAPDCKQKSGDAGVNGQAPYKCIPKYTGAVVFNGDCNKPPFGDGAGRNKTTQSARNWTAFARQCCNSEGDCGPQHHKVPVFPNYGN